MLTRELLNWIPPILTLRLGCNYSKLGAPRDLINTAPQCLKTFTLKRIRMASAFRLARNGVCKVLQPSNLNSPLSIPDA